MRAKFGVRLAKMNQESANVHDVLSKLAKRWLALTKNIDYIAQVCRGLPDVAQIG